MDMPTEDTPAAAYLAKSAYTVSRVAVDKQAKGLEQGLENAHVQLKKSLRDKEDLEEVEQKKTAVLDAGDSDCDDHIESFELGLLAVVKKDRADDRYRRYIKVGLRDITTAEPRKEEPKLVGQMLEAMAEDAAKADAELAPLLAASMPKLTASREQVVKADEQLTTTETELAFLEDMTIPSLMATWRAEYKKLEGALTTVYPTNAKKVDRFFKPFRKPRRTKKTAGSAATPAAAPPAAAPPAAAPPAVPPVP
jgi:hypothetical protein